MWGAAIASYVTTKREIHEKNDFNFIPIKEVAILFAGIFATMIPALDWLELNASVLRIVQPGQYYWGSGILSSFLDNAPTYLNFLSASFGLHGASIENVNHMKLMLNTATPEMLNLPNPLQEGARMITADTWMVKSIAEQSKAECPSFFGYIFRYSLPVLIPIYALVWYLFLKS
jgi:hypothetical protein